MGVAMAALPFVTGVLAAFVAYGRWQVAPIGQTLEKRAIRAWP